MRSRWQFWTCVYVYVCVVWCGVVLCGVVWCGVCAVVGDGGGGFQCQFVWLW